MSMKAASALERGSGAAAAAAAAARCAEALGGASCDLAIVFVEASVADESLAISAAVRGTLGPKVFLGVTGGTVVEGSREIEDEPSVAVWAASLPATTLTPFVAEFRRDEDESSIDGVPPIPEGASVILFADPYTFPADMLLEHLHDERPGALVTGGLASGARGPGGHRLWCNDHVLNAGAAGVILEGGVKIRALVSQGCRPIGTPLTVTRAERNLVFEVAGSTALDRIRETYLNASVEEQALMQRGLHVGRVVDEYKADFERGDFLIRNVLGVDEGTGAMAVGDVVEVGETIQFHVRDAGTADEDLREAAAKTPAPGAALLFTCNGRGSHLFEEPDHDAGVLAQAWGGIPIAGFSCAGEIGPVGGRSFLHGFTASVALFYDA